MLRVATAFLLVAHSLCLWADTKQNAQPEAFIHSDSMISLQTSEVPASSPNSSVVIDFSQATGESWDAKGQARNVVENCLQGDTITGLEWRNVQVQTVGNSFLSEATIKFSDSTGNGGVELSVGYGTEQAGTQSFSSTSIFDLTDSSIQDISSGADKLFMMELFELVDDAANQVDARYLSGTVTVWGQNLSPNPGCRFVSGGASDTTLNASLSTNDSPRRLNDEFETTLNIENTGSISATGVQAQMTIPPQLNLLSSSCSDSSQGVQSNDQLALTLQDLAAGASVSCTLSFRVVNYGGIEITANVSGSNLSNSPAPASMTLGGSALVIPASSAISLSVLSILFLLFAFYNFRKGNFNNRSQSS